MCRSRATTGSGLLGTTDRPARSLDPTTTSSPGSPLRIGDTERDAAVDLLSRAFAEGYLDQAELDVRTERALAATTTAELAELRLDLPGRLDPALEVAAAARRSTARRGAHAHLVSYGAGVALMLALWLVTALLFGATYFWPVWPILGWGIGVASHVLPVRRQLALPVGRHP